MNNGKLTIALVGLGFGAVFAPIYAAHPNVDRVILVDALRGKAEHTLNRCKRFSDRVEIVEDFASVLADPTVDAVHVCTGIPNHAELTVATLKAGKHCACAVPMATSLEDIQRIVDAVRESGKNYMMMETELYEAAFLYARDMLANNEFGRIQFMRGVHHQCMDHGAWNTKMTHYWQGLPPMWYITHALSPLCVAANSPVREVVCFGSGTMAEEKVQNYGNPYPVEDMLIRFESGLAAEVSRAMHECSIKQTESYNIYGSKKSFMYEYRHEVWEQFYDEAQYDKVGFHTEVVEYPNRYDLLPEEIQRFTVEGGEWSDDWKEKLTTAPLAQHSGSHAHLCHEFVSSILENRKSAVDEILSANITATGICAHKSAMNGGHLEIVPQF
jgi:predicted dehydrogenase